MKKTLIAIILMLATVAALVSCGGNTTDETTTTTTTSKTTTTRQLNNIPVDDDDDDLTDYTDLFIPYGSAVIDGVREASWDSAAAVALEKVKKGSIPEGVEVTASAMWDNNAIYFLFEIIDPDIYQTGAVGDYNIDGIYLYISEDIEFMTSAFADFSNGVYQFALINPELELIPRHGTESEVHNAQTGYTITETGMTIEFCYTPAISPLAPGNFILLDYQYNDAASTGVRNGGLGWYNGSDTNTQTMLWAYAKLLAQGEQAPKN